MTSFRVVGCTLPRGQQSMFAGVQTVKLCQEMSALPFFRSWPEEWPPLFAGVKKDTQTVKGAQ